MCAPYYIDLVLLSFLSVRVAVESDSTFDPFKHQHHRTVQFEDQNSSLGQRNERSSKIIVHYQTRNGALVNHQTQRRKVVMPRTLAQALEAAEFEELKGRLCHTF